MPRERTQELLPLVRGGVAGVVVDRRSGTPLLWPNHLKTYKDCPQRYFLQFVRKRKGRLLDTSAMKRGQVTHNVLAQAFRYFGARNAFPEGLNKRIVERLPVDEYPSRDHWEQDVRVIGDWVENAIESFDTRKSVMAVEKTYVFPFQGRVAEPAFNLNARVDLVLRLDDGAVEHVDWKTGKRGWVDEIQNVAARLSVGRTLQESRVVSTVSFLSAANGEFEESSELSRTEVREGWAEIKRLATGICTDDQWTPKQGPLCNWCPYYQHGCKLHRATEDDWAG
jgi:hypothetical protein